jgi:hypothetical protein
MPMGTGTFCWLWSLRPSVGRPLRERAGRRGACGMGAE